MLESLNCGGRRACFFWVRARPTPPPGSYRHTVQIASMHYQAPRCKVVVKPPTPSFFPVLCAQFTSLSPLASPPSPSASFTTPPSFVDCPANLAQFQQQVERFALGWPSTPLPPKPIGFVVGKQRC